MRHLRIKALSAAAIICTCPVAAFAQDSDFDRLMAMDSGSLEGEIQTRYDAGLATSLDSAIQAANDPRYLWALEAKVQCGIALGYLKSSTRDETSIRNCDRAYHRMTYVAPRAPAPGARCCAKAVLSMAKTTASRIADRTTVEALMKTSARMQDGRKYKRVLATKRHKMLGCRWQSIEGRPSLHSRVVLPAKLNCSLVGNHGDVAVLLEYRGGDCSRHGFCQSLGQYRSLFRSGCEQ